MAVIPEGEARYRVAELLRTHPQLGFLALKLQVEGIADWVKLLEKLQQAVAERS
jgi:hypothetical protein